MNTINYENACPLFDRSIILQCGKQRYSAQSDFSPRKPEGDWGHCKGARPRSGVLHPAPSTRPHGAPLSNQKKNPRRRGPATWESGGHGSGNRQYKRELRNVNSRVNDCVAHSHPLARLMASPNDKESRIYRYALSRFHWHLL